MKNRIFTLRLTPLFFACTLTLAQTTPTERDYQLPRCDKPVATVWISNLSCNLAGCKPPGESLNSKFLNIASMLGGPKQADLSGVSNSMTEMLGTVLKQTQCFTLLESKPAAAPTQPNNPAGDAPVEPLASFDVSGDITTLSQKWEETRIAMFTKSKEIANLAVNLKLTPAGATQALDSKSFVGNNETSERGVSLGVFKTGGASVGIDLGATSPASLKGTVMEPVIQEVLMRMAAFAANRLVAESGKKE